MTLDPSQMSETAAANRPALPPILDGEIDQPTQNSSGRDKAEIYGSFMIDQSEFAIPVSAVKEVVNEPREISAVPLSPPYMLGLFNLRGMIIPIVDLRRLLEYPEMKNPQTRKVAIIEHGEHCIGLMFDKTGEVLNEHHAARVEFQPNNRGIKDIVIEGVLKFEDGERLVQTLDPYEILSLEKLPRARSSQQTNVTKAARGKRRNCISFQTGHTSCAIDLRYVKEVREMPQVDRTLFAHGDVLGTSNLRGVILPVIDFRGFMGDDAKLDLEKISPKDRRMLVIETSYGPIGLMVYSIDSILPYFEDEVLPFAKLALPRGDFVNGCLIDDDNKIVMMLDQNKLMNEPEFLATAKSCQEVYPAKTADKKDAKKVSGSARRTFIQFTFERKFALDTAHVSEVIDRPSELLEPPFSLDFVEGIINLRDELITLVNPRLLYGLSPATGEGQKVVIFRHEDQKFGILVDSVDEIIMTTENSVAELKGMDQRDTARNVAEDVIGCLRHNSTGGGISSVLILDVKALVNRCVKAAEHT